MKKATKAWLIAAGILILTGCVLFAVLLSGLKWDFSKLSTGKYETNIYEVDKTFGNISFTTDTADISFALSDDGKCRVECYEEENAKHSVSVEDDILTVKINDKRAWYDYIGFNFESPKITVYLPETEYKALFIEECTGNVELPKDCSFGSVDISVTTGNVNIFAAIRDEAKVKTSTGNIRAENISAETLDFSVTTGTVTVSNVVCKGDVSVNVSTGKANLTDISCKNLTSSGSTGNLSLNNVIAEEMMSVKRSTGDIIVKDCDAAEIYMKTSTGSVFGNFLSDKVFVTDTGTGSVNVPETVTGGKCEIKTSTGDIKITK